MGPPRPPTIPAIPDPNISDMPAFDAEKDYAPKWDHDTDTLASFLTWKSASHHNQQTKRLIDAILVPMCQFVREELKQQLANQSTTVRIPGLQDIKNREEETQQQIRTLTNTVNELTKQVATLSARPTPITRAAPVATLAPTQQSPKPPTTKKPTPPTAPTYAQVVEKQPKEFTEVRSKKKAKKETILPKPYPTADRLIIFSLTTAPNDRKEAANRALQLVNKAITNHADIEHPPLILANITATNNLVLTVAPQYLSTTYEPYLAILEDALHEFPIALSRISQRWTRFIVNSIPTTATPEAVRTEIETNYPALRMGQTPRWLTSPERRQGKKASSMIITFIGEMTKKSLGATSLAMFNRECTITEYIMFGPTTQCNKCQTFGHPTQRCTASNYTCAVCAQPHPMKNHPCAIASCKAGHSCNHPPIRCSNCHQPHKASDRNCPTLAKITLGMRRDNAAPTDTVMAV